MSNRRRKKSVTWSPVVKAFSRPSNLTEDTLEETKSEFLIEMIDKSKKISGNVTAHSRKNTRNFLITIRKNQRHRELQLLIDLPYQAIKRIYDGETTYTVSQTPSDGEKMSLIKISLGSILWKDDDIVRDVGARGFGLEWLNGIHELSLKENAAKKIRRNKNSNAKSLSKRKRISSRLKRIL